MKRLSLSLLLATFALLAAGPDSFESARKLAGKTGRDLAVLVHGSDWNRPGERYRKAVWDSPRLSESMGRDYVLFSIDVPENPNKKRKEQLAARRKGFTTRLGNYPALVLYDPEGQQMRLFTGDTFPYAPKETLAALREIHELRLARDHLLAQAKDARPEKAAMLLVQALELDVGLRKEITERLKQLAPESSSDWLPRATFDGRGTFAHAEELTKAKKHADAVAYLDKLLDNPRLQPEQQAWLLAAKGNVYRQWGKPELAHTTLMQAFAACPDSVMGKAARRLSLRFVGPPSIEFGWEDRHCQQKETSWQLDLSPQLTKPGDWQLVFRRKKRTGTIRITELRVMDGETAVLLDKTARTLDAKHPDATYELHLANSPRRPVLSVTWLSPDGEPSTGEILLARQEDRQ